MAELDDVVAGHAAKFDALRGISALETLELLAPSDDANDYRVIETVDVGWFVEFGENRKECVVKIANSDEVFTAKMNEKTAVRINGRVYQARTDDTLPIETIKNPYWRIFCGREFRQTDYRSAY